MSKLLCSVEKYSFFETEHANTSEKILLLNGVVIKSCYKTGQLSIKNIYFVNTVENIPHSTKTIVIS